MSHSLPKILITGASSGIGATYAERFAQRGHDLVLVARNAERLGDLATRLRAKFGVAVDTIAADLTVAADLARVEARLADDAAIGVLINNAGAAAPGSFVGADVEAWDRLIQLNVTALTRLVAAAVPGFLDRKAGAIVNIASVVGLAPEIPLGMYGATKAYVLALSQALAAELGPKGLYVQAVLPAATRTEIWERSGRSVDDLTGVMDVEEMVDAALVGFDRREAVTLPSLPDAGQWVAFEAARQAMLPNFAQTHSAERYHA